MSILSLNELLAEIKVAEASITELGERERRFWDRLVISPAKWEQRQYPGARLFWVVAVMGRRCLYYNDVECGWGWGRFEEWGVVREYHWQQDEIQHVVFQTLLAIEEGGEG
jgi:hypothetical protein